MQPRGDLSSTGYALADPGKQYLVLQPSEEAEGFTVTMAAGRYVAEWYSVTTLHTRRTGAVAVKDEAAVSFHSSVRTVWGVDLGPEAGCMKSAAALGRPRGTGCVSLLRQSGGHSSDAEFCLVLEPVSRGGETQLLLRGSTRSSVRSPTRCCGRSERSHLGGRDSASGDLAATDPGSLACRRDPRPGIRRAVQPGSIRSTRGTPRGGDRC